MEQALSSMLQSWSLSHPKPGIPRNNSPLFSAQKMPQILPTIPGMHQPKPRIPRNNFPFVLPSEKAPNPPNNSGNVPALSYGNKRLGQAQSLSKTKARIPRNNFPSFCPQKMPQIPPTIPGMPQPKPGIPRNSFFFHFPLRNCSKSLPTAPRMPQL